MTRVCFEYPFYRRREQDARGREKGIGSLREGYREEGGSDTPHPTGRDLRKILFICDSAVFLINLKN